MSDNWGIHMKSLNERIKQQLLKDQKDKHYQQNIYISLNTTFLLKIHI